MRGFLLMIAIAAVAGVTPGGTAYAGASRLYDMSTILNQRHPFDRSPGRTRAGAPAPAPRPVAGPAPAPPLAPAPPPAATPRRRPPSGWISEIRGGILKHSIAFGHRGKETGVDANLEVLFVSPDWSLFKALWAPRPHIGASFNASSTNTDQVYAGLTWEWAPADWFFANFSFGGSLHDGRLRNKIDPFLLLNSTQRNNRHREFGCRVLFRESLELGYRFLENHSVSLMWSHISHGGICDDENDGMDNAGIRYGYGF